jgi:hypothetical protein
LPVAPALLIRQELAHVWTFGSANWEALVLIIVGSISTIGIFHPDAEDIL